MAYYFEITFSGNTCVKKIKLLSYKLLNLAQMKKSAV